MFTAKTLKSTKCINTHPPNHNSDSYPLFCQISFLKILGTFYHLGEIVAFLTSCNFQQHLTLWTDPVPPLYCPLTTSLWLSYFVGPVSLFSSAASLHQSQLSNLSALNAFTFMALLMYLEVHRTYYLLLEFLDLQSNLLVNSSWMSRRHLKLTLQN